MRGPEIADSHGRLTLARSLIVVALAAVPSCQSQAQGIEQQLYSFGVPGAVDPEAPLLKGTDGALYGTTLSGGINGNGTVFRLSTNGSDYTVLYSFTGTGGDGSSPLAGLVQGIDGALYGTTESGGANGNFGTVFKLSTNGSGYSVLHAFQGPGDGAYPQAGLVHGADGMLYGTTYSGGTNYVGTVFKLNTNGSSYIVLHNFPSTSSDGAGLQAGLVQGADGALYGTTASGGLSEYGTIFKLSTDGSGYSVLHSFSGTGGDGTSPYAGLVQGADGLLYGTTASGGTNGYGTVFKLSTNGSGYGVLYSFTDTGGDGASPNAVLQGADGRLYGTTHSGGTNSYGTIFKLSTNGSGYSVLHDFTGAGGDGRLPAAGLVQGAGGALYGTTSAPSSGGVNGYGTIFRLSNNGSGYSLLYTFIGAGADGANPYAGLVQGADGMLYGTTYSGGTNGTGNGAVFKLSTNGSGENMLYAFADTNGDGANPYAGLVQGADGMLYGTTYSAGTNGYGTVFKLGTNGSSYNVLHRFPSGFGDGTYTYAGLVQGADGALYGTTYNGGINAGGIIFKLSTNGSNYIVLHSFPGLGLDGLFPEAGLTQGADGALYGTTYAGGTYGYGIVFQISTNGSIYRMLYSFTDAGGDGAYPHAKLMQGADGFLYGTTSSGGTAFGYGTVFKLSTNGSGYSVLHNFLGTNLDGAHPDACLVQCADGMLYGTTYDGGTNGNGTIFRLSANGSGYGVLHNFPGTNWDGASPQAGLMQGADGALYGTTFGGGLQGNGTVFRFLTPPLILTQPQNTSALPGGSASFSVMASGVPTPRYQWQRAATSLLNGGQFNGANSNTLTISGISPANVGNYAVVITNAYGSVTSSIVSLTVTVPLLANLVHATASNRVPAVHLQFTGIASSSYVLQYATNLSRPVMWQPVVTNSTDTNGNWTFIYTNISSFPARFFRMAAP